MRFEQTLRYAIIVVLLFFSLPLPLGLAALPAEARPVLHATAAPFDLTPAPIHLTRCGAGGPCYATADSAPLTVTLSGPRTITYGDDCSATLSGGTLAPNGQFSGGKITIECPVTISAVPVPQVKR